METFQEVSEAFQSFWRISWGPREFQGLGDISVSSRGFTGATGSITRAFPWVHGGPREFSVIFQEVSKVFQRDAQALQGSFWGLGMVSGALQRVFEGRFRGNSVDVTEAFSEVSDVLMCVTWVPRQ